ncbi:cyclic nucleotide-binding domain-containing protein 1 [Vombatus ursinus]|uniref:cyclic nucleotide-binding domain-containing protein 1 n=1 Tax=Vombatus ursinus TaxID=29139 RepID=UPI000FFD069F|nr:cyclic nucleotide-binding domain-containing protein 1 [Vombatus ursinus]
MPLSSICQSILTLMEGIPPVPPQGVPTLVQRSFEISFCTGGSCSDVHLPMYTLMLPVAATTTSATVLKGARGTKEAHENFMKHYKKIFQKEKKILPYPPTTPVKLASFVDPGVGPMNDNIHDIGFYVRDIHCQTSAELAHQFKDKVEEFITVLKKFPIHRTHAECRFVYKMMKTMPDLSSQLTRDDFKALSRNITSETWLKGTTVVANEGFYIILKGFVRPRSKVYKKMIELVPTDFLSEQSSEYLSEEELFQESPLAEYHSLMYPHYIILGPWNGFGTLIELPEPKLSSNLYSLIMEEDCELLKINAKEYAKIKEKQAKMEKLTREQLIHKCPYYRNWPKLSVEELTVHIKWRRYPPGHVLVTDGEIISFVAYIQSGFCKVYREVIGFMKCQLRKMKKKRRRVFMGKLQEKESFGEISVLLQIPFTCTIITGSEVELGIINAEDMLELDWVTRKLVLQTAEQTFGYLTDLFVTSSTSNIFQNLAHTRFFCKTEMMMIMMTMTTTAMVLVVMTISIHMHTALCGLKTLSTQQFGWK